jgi:hypothetical protein
MTGKELDHVRDCVEEVGFHYTFRYYTGFNEIKDEKFHTLRKAYIEAATELSTYLNLEE